ncbi:MAG TPA: leucyl aminopeptidase [Chitinivibrionales bacterium]|jgi:leucyl aminopeptidase|nr:leucyl aminopeptidase [Chitinivibrionales bacterium]
MKLSVSKTAHFPTQIVFVTKESTSGVPDFEAAKNKTTVRYDGKKAVVYCGLGEAGAVTAAVIRSAAAAGTRAALELKRSELSLVVPRAGRHVRDHWTPALEGAILGGYKFTKYKKEKAVSIDSLEVVGEAVPLRGAGRVLDVCEAVNFSRDLVNENAHVAHPEFLAGQARAIARAGNMAVEVLTEKEIAKKGLGLLAAVGQGSEYPPRLAIIEYRGNRSSRDITAIVGKGITFDSGGQNLKPTGHIETMRCDMAGSAAVLGVMKALAALSPAVNVAGVCALAHNAVGERAYFPGDVYAAYNGTTVEIASTDAEGRLVLADAISYCKETRRPSRIIDLATLTGGILSSLGTTVAGLFSNDDDLAKRLFAAGEESGERLWRFPLYPEYAESIKSDIADLSNVSRFKKGYASSITGAAFIGEFVGKTPWAHIDIAGTAFNEEAASGEVPQFATGFGVRLLLKFLGVE